MTRANSPKKSTTVAANSVSDVPPNGIVGVPASNFGLGGQNFHTPPADVTQKVLSAKVSEIKNSPALPIYRNLSAKMSKDIRVENPKFENIDRRVKIGATERKIGVSVDENLRQERIYGNRPAIERKSNTETIKGSLEARPETRDTGAVKRLPRSSRQISENSKKEESASDDNKIRATGGKSDDGRQNAPVRKPREDDRDIRPAPPVYIPPPPKRERKERIEPPVKEQQRREDAPPKREEPRDQPPPPREDRPSERKPAPPAIESRKAKEEAKEETKDKR